MRALIVTLCLFFAGFIFFGLLYTLYCLLSMIGTIIAGIVILFLLVWGIIHWVLRDIQ